MAIGPNIWLQLSLQINLCGIINPLLSLLKHGLNNSFPENPFRGVFFNFQPQAIRMIRSAAEFIIVQPMNVILSRENILVHYCQYPVNSLRRKLLNQTTVVLKKSGTEAFPRDRIASVEMPIPKVVCMISG